MVSIIIPMRNEERFVAACLESVLAQLDDVPACEVICVDGRSTDRTPDIVRAYAARDQRIRLIENPAGIVPAGMNLAIREARGDVIVRMDCHAEYARDYLKNCLEVLRRTGADNVGGYIRTLPSEDSRVGRAIAAATSSRFGVGGSAFRTGGPEREADTVPFGCFRRQVFERYGMYDERLVRNQDIELNSRIRAGGGKIVISPAIRLTYYGRSSFGDLRQQAFANGLWNAYTLYLVRGGLRVRHFVPLVFVCTLVALAVGGFFLTPLWALLGCLVLAYLAAASIAAVPAACNARTPALLVVLAFTHLHLAYGLGSLWGLFTAPVVLGGWPRRLCMSHSPTDRRE